MLNFSLLCEFVTFFELKNLILFFECCEQVSSTAICEKKYPERVAVYNTEEA